MSGFAGGCRSSELIPEHPEQLGEHGESLQSREQSCSWDLALSRVVGTAFPPPTVPGLGKVRAGAGEQLLSAMPGISQLQGCSRGHPHPHTSEQGGKFGIFQEAFSRLWVGEGAAAFSPRN